MKFVYLCIFKLCVKAVQCALIHRECLCLNDFVAVGILRREHVEGG